MRFPFQLVYWSYRTVSGVWYWSRRRFTRAGLCVVVAFAVAASTGVDVERTMTYQAFAALLGLLGVAILGGWHWRAKFTVERHLPRLGTAGQVLSYRVRVQNPGAQPLAGLALLEELADPRPDFATWLDYQRAEGRRSRTFHFSTRRRAQPFRRVELREGTVPPLPARGEAEVTMELLPLRRGVLRFASVTLARPDVFGLFRALVRVPAAQSVLILPRRYPVPPIALPGTVKYQPGGVALAASVGTSEEFASLRDYRPGDPLRHIHWRSWARLGRPIVKEFADEYFVRHALVLDTFTDDFYSEILEEAVAVAASFACTVLTQESLLDLLFVGAQSYCFTAGRGLAQADQMLEVLAAVTPCASRPFATLEHLVLDHAAQVSGCICVLLAWDTPRRALVKRLRQAGVPVLTLVIVAPGTKLSAEDIDAFYVLELGQVAGQLAALK